MDDKSFNIRVPKRGVRVALIVGVTALIVAPLTAIASHSFTDVPDSNTFHEDIAWLADAGVTKGCNPPANTEFCPGDDVTRGQMSAFMRRFAQYIGAEDGTPAQADNADTVDGQHASAFLGVNAKAADSDKLDGLDSADLGASQGASSNDVLEGLGTTNIGPGTTVVESLSANAPADGAFVIMYSAAMKSNESFGNGEILIYGQVAVDGTDIPGSFSSEVLDDEVNHFFEQGTVSSQVVVPVSAGSHTVDLKLTLNEQDADDSAGVWGSSLVVFWVPSGTYTTSFDAAGSDPSAATQK